MTQKPSPCCFVLYHFLDGPWYPAGSTTPEYKIATRPAVVTSVSESDPEGMTVNLHVFFEPNDTEFHPTSKTAKTAIDEELAPVRHRYDVEPCHPDPFRPATPQTWSWPPRV